MEPLINNPGYQHIVEDIFLNLDQKEIFQCRLVKKSWKRFFQNQKRIFWLKKFQYPLHHCEFEDSLGNFLLSKYLGASKWKNEVMVIKNTLNENDWPRTILEICQKK